jgi:epoxide hydrolase-like predicted phosphatase
MIKAVIFDCFGVFYIDPVFAYMRSPQSPAKTSSALHALDKQAAQGNLTKSQFIDQAAVLLQRDKGAIEQEFFHRAAPNTKLANYVRSLRPIYKTALLSNIGSDMMDGFFSPKEYEQLFDEVILSGAVKLAKPDAAIFKLACQRLDVALHEAVMVDDMESNCVATQQLGMKAICYKNFEQASRDLARLLA